MWDYEALKFWMDVAQTFGLLGIFIWGLVTRRQLMNAGLLEKHADRLIKVETALEVIKVGKMGMNDAEKLYLRLDEQSRKNGEILAKLSGVAEAVEGLKADVARLYEVRGNG